MAKPSVRSDDDLMNGDLTLPISYEQFLGQLKEKIRVAQIRAGLAVNKELIFLYWDIGTEILARQEEKG